MVFLANGYGGLRAYNFDGSSFIPKVHAPIDSFEAVDVVVADDNTVFLAVMQASGGGSIRYPCPPCPSPPDDGLYAYNFDGKSLIKKAHIDDDGRAYSVAIGIGDTIFLANGEDGLRAYKFDGHSFIYSGHLKIEAKSVFDVEVREDGVIFIVTGEAVGVGEELYAFTYKDSLFTKMAYIYVGDYISGIAVGPEGTLFLSGGYIGLQAYGYNGFRFYNTAKIEVGVSDDFWPYSVAVNSDGIVFLASYDGLYAYEFTGSSFIMLAYNNGIDPSNVSVGKDGTIFVINEGKLIAYNFSAITGFTEQLAIA